MLYCGVFIIMVQYCTMVSIVQCGKYGVVLYGSEFGAVLYSSEYGAVMYRGFSALQ